MWAANCDLRAVSHPYDVWSCDLPKKDFPSERWNFSLLEGKRWDLRDIIGSNHRKCARPFFSPGFNWPRSLPSLLLDRFNFSNWLFCSCVKVLLLQLTPHKWPKPRYTITVKYKYKWKYTIIDTRNTVSNGILTACTSSSLSSRLVSGNW